MLKPKINRDLSLIVLFIGIIIVLNCYSLGCIKDEPKKRYRDGELFIRFNSTLNETEAEDIIANYGLEIIQKPNRPNASYKIEVPDGKEDYYVELLEKNPNIISVDRVNEDP